MLRVFVVLVSLGVRALRAVCRRRADIVMENLALRQQVTALKKERPRPALDDIDRAFWVTLRSSWPARASRLVIVNADTVARWHRDRFRVYWAKISRRRNPGQPRVDAEIRRLIQQMAQDGWGAPRIHAELTKLGFIVSEITVSRYMPRRPAEPDQVKRWIAFLRNHKDDIAAMDLFAVPTASLRLLYGFFVIEHGRRHIVHFNATFHPTAAWVIQQLRDAFPTTRRRDISSSTATPSSARPSSNSSSRWERGRCARLFAAHGKTEPLSAGSVAVVERCSNTSSS